MVRINQPSTVYIKFSGNLPRKFTVHMREGDLYYFRYLNGKTPRIKFNIPNPGFYKMSEGAEIVKIVPIEIPDSYPVIPEYERNRLRAGSPGTASTSDFKYWRGEMGEYKGWDFYPESGSDGKKGQNTSDDSSPCCA